MRSQFIIPLLSLIILTASQPNNSFNYEYQIKSNSFSPMDEAAAYYYKENMILKYESFFFSLDEEERTIYIFNHLDFFKLTDDANVSLNGGRICIGIGDGKGRIISGKFRKNYCDESVINEKYFFLELFK